MSPFEVQYLEELLTVLADDEKKMRDQLIHLDGQIAYNLRMRNAFEEELATHNSGIGEQKSETQDTGM